MVYQTRDGSGVEHCWKLPTCTCLRHFIFLVFYRYKDMVPQNGTNIRLGCWAKMIHDCTANAQYVTANL